MELTQKNKEKHKRRRQETHVYVVQPKSGYVDRQSELIIVKVKRQDKNLRWPVQRSTQKASKQILITKSCLPKLETFRDYDRLHLQHIDKEMSHNLNHPMHSKIGPIYRILI